MAHLNKLKIQSLESMLEENQDQINCDERILDFIKDKERYSKLEYWNSPDQSGNTLLHSAAKCNNTIVAQYLLETGSKIDVQNNFGKTPLMVAIQKMSVKVIESLLEANADLNVVDNEYRSALSYLYDYNRTHSDGHLFILKMLVDRCASIILIAHNASWSQVDLVLRYGNRDAIAILLQANLDLTRKDKDGNTPVHILAKNKNLEVLKALDNRYFDVNARNSKLQMPLYFAVIYSISHTVQYLLNRGADINGLNGTCGSALYNAVYFFNTNCGERYMECVEILLEYGADVRLKTKDLNALLATIKKSASKLLNNVAKIIIARLVVQEAHGTEISDRTHAILEEEPTFKTYYDSGQQQLLTVVNESLTLFDLLTMNELKLEGYVRNQALLTKVQDFCHKNESESHCLYKILQIRINRAIQMAKRKKDSACVISYIMNMEYEIFHLIADKIISYLSEQDLHYLSQVLS